MAFQLLSKKLVPMQRLLCVCPISGFSGDDEIRNRFEAWAVEHGKSYETVEEKEKRFEISREKLRSIEKLSSENPGCCNWGLTKFSDLTWDELHCSYCNIP